MTKLMGLKNYGVLEKLGYKHERVKYPEREHSRGRGKYKQL